MQDRRLLKHTGIGRRTTLIGPLARKSHRATALLEQRKHFTAADPPDLQDQKPLPQQRMKRMSYGRPSQMGLVMECSLLGVSQPFAIGWVKKSFDDFSNRSLNRRFMTRLMASGQNATVIKPFKRY